jgi:hypothetical protein
MGRYLDILERLEPEQEQGHDKNDINDKSPTPAGHGNTFGRFGRFGRTFRELERRCPALVDEVRWRQAIADAQSFLGMWGEQAAALGWSEHELFGLHPVPERPAASYHRLSRYDATGLLWLLEGRSVVALTAETAAIQAQGGAALTYRKHRKPTLGPLGDSLDDLGAA